METTSPSIIPISADLRRVESGKQPDNKNDVTILTFIPPGETECQIEMLGFPNVEGIPALSWRFVRAMCDLQLAEPIRSAFVGPNATNIETTPPEVDKHYRLMQGVSFIAVEPLADQYGRTKIIFRADSTFMRRLEAKALKL